MKIFLVLLTMLIFGTIAYKYKNKFKLKLNTILIIIDYINYYETNINFFRESLFNINSNYIIMQENKNAKNNIFKLKSNTLLINYDYLIRLFKSDEISIINKYFEEMGNREYNEEKIKNDNILKFLTSLKEKTKDDLKTNGEMWFKIILMIGVIVSIIIW